MIFLMLHKPDNQGLLLVIVVLSVISAVGVWVLGGPMSSEKVILGVQRPLFICIPTDQ